MDEQGVTAYVDGVRARDRTWIGRTVTLVESTRADHRKLAAAVLDVLQPHTGRSFRIGITGVPGVGKSTLIDAFGTMLSARGHRVAVLAVETTDDIKAPSTLNKKGTDEDLHWHDLRHECGSRLAEQGVPVHEIQYLLGHGSLVTTQRYLNATEEALRKSVKVLEQEVG